MSRGEPGGSGSRDCPAVLVVDDDRICRGFCARVLRAAEYRVAVAGTARRALDLLPAFDPHVVLADLTLPDPPQRDRLHAVCAEPACPGRPALILMTAGCDHGAIPHGAAAKVLRKPFEPRDLLQAVAAALPRNRAAADGRVRDEVISVAMQLSGEFSSALRRELGRLDRRIAARHWLAVLDILHRLRGAAAICGHADFAANCRELADCFGSDGPVPGWGRCYLDLLRAGEALCGTADAITRGE